MAKGRQATRWVWTGLEGRFASETARGAQFIPDGGMEAFPVPTAYVGKVLYRDGTWQQSGPLKLNVPVVELQLADWLAKQRGLA